MVLGTLVLAGLATALWSGLPQLAVIQTQSAVQSVEGAVPRVHPTISSEMCERAFSAGQRIFKSEQARWQRASEAGGRQRDFGKRAMAAQTRALDRFDSRLEVAGACTDERAILESLMVGEVHEAFSVQRQLLEDEVAKTLSQRLLQGMWRRGGPLRVWEKVAMLREAAASYESGLARLLIANLRSDVSSAEVEERLGQLQFGIEASTEGNTVLEALEQKRRQRLLDTRAHGVAVSVDPGLRVMVRPEGLGNFQIFSEGPVRPFGSSGNMHVGIINDGSIADVYREHPVPPMLAVQPAMQVNVKVR